MFGGCTSLESLDLSGWDARCWNLGARNPDHPVVRHVDGRTVVEQPEFLSDSLFVFRRYS